MPLPPLKEPTDLGSRIKNLSRAVPITGFLFSALIAANLVQTLSLLLLPFSRHAFRRVNRELADWWWGMCVTIGKKLYGIRPKLYGDQLPMRENAVVVVNHQQMPDITFLMGLARSCDRLGDLKWFVKDKIKWVPGVGWGMVFLDCLFVKRDWAEDRDSIQRTFSRILRDEVPLWLMIFPEGTRLRPAKLEASQRYAARHGLAPTRHVLLPRTKGFAAAIMGLRQHVTAVYDITIGYEQGVPTLWQYVKGLCRVAHLQIQRVPVQDLPQSEEDLSNWLNQRFQRKDRLLDDFFRTGSFPS